MRPVINWRGFHKCFKFYNSKVSMWGLFAPVLYLCLVWPITRAWQQRETEREMESPFNADLLKGKVALLTGGGSGIGFEISTQFGKHGASIAIMGRRQQVLDTAVSALHSLGIPVHLSFLTFSLVISRFYSSTPSICVLLFLFLYLLLVMACWENRSNNNKE